MAYEYQVTNKRYHTLNYFYKQKFGKKVFKVSLNMGLTCPNKVNGSGCIFCSNSSGDFAGNPYDDIATQFETIKSMMEKKWPDAYYIGYFQSGTNTYAPLEVLKKNYEEMKQIIREEIDYRGVSVIIPRRECIQTLARKKRSK